jgi:hypothetical protein
MSATMEDKAMLTLTNPSPEMGATTVVTKQFDANERPFTYPYGNTCYLQVVQEHIGQEPWSTWSLTICGAC